MKAVSHPAAEATKVTENNRWLNLSFQPSRLELTFHFNFPKKGWQDERRGKGDLHIIDRCCDDVEDGWKECSGFEDGTAGMGNGGGGIIGGGWVGFWIAVRVSGVIVEYVGFESSRSWRRGSCKA